MQQEHIALNMGLIIFRRKGIPGSVCVFDFLFYKNYARTPVALVMGGNASPWVRLLNIRDIYPFLVSRNRRVLYLVAAWTCVPSSVRRSKYPVALRQKTKHSRPPESIFAFCV